MFDNYPETLKKIIKNLSRLSGIGPKTAERLAFNLIDSDEDFMTELSDSIIDVRDKINEYAGKYIDELICVDNEFDIVQSWVSKTEPGTNHHHHHHKGALFSLVYYAQADNSKLTFDSKDNFLTKGFNFDYNVKEQNILNSLEVEFTPKTGDILIFPGYIEHSAENLDNKTKYIIGANYFIRGDIGVYNNTTLVKNI